MKYFIGLIAAVSFSLMAASPKWVEQSNQYAMEVLDLIAQLNPENGSALGIEKYDERVADVSLTADQSALAQIAQEIKTLQQAEQKTTDPRVLQDLQIMIQVLQQQVKTNELEQQYLLPFNDVGQNIFLGLKTLLDEQNTPERQQRAVTRLAAYVGMAGQTAITEQAKHRTMAVLTNKTLVTPYRREVEQVISNIPAYTSGLEQLFTQAKLTGWRPAFNQLAQQLADYRKWLQETVLPIARSSNVMPKPLYANALINMGVDMSPDELMQRALFEYAEIRDEMQVLATQIAKKRGYKNHDYRYVLQQLKQDQVTGEQVLLFFKKRLAEIEQIVREHHIVTLPKRKASIHIASAAETAVSPAPHLNPPRLIGNTGEYGEFVLPKLDQGSGGNDFTSKGFSWTITVHEARPGHELQFSNMIEQGVSKARAIFAMNSANVEGWALYSEAIMKQYMPPEGQLFSLQARLQRAARAFLDPMLNLGLMTPAEAKRVLTDDVVLSDSFAQSEVDRYTYRMPGQATSYFYGYMALRQLRISTEFRLQDKFNQQSFHDFILAQGLLPPALLKEAVEKYYIPQVEQQHQ